MALNFLTSRATALFGTADAESRKSGKRRWKCQRTNETLNTNNSSRLGEGQTLGERYLKSKEDK
jgi:hypothetical protein